MVPRRSRTRTLAVVLTAIAGVLLCLTGCARTPDPGPLQPTPTQRVQATPGGLVLDGKPWWPAGFNAYQLGTDWAVNSGCGAEVDLDAYFAKLPPRALTRFNVFSSFAVHKRSGLLDFAPLDRVFAAAARHRQLVLPVLAGGSGDCEDGRFKDREFYARGWRTPPSVNQPSFAQWVETAVTRWHDEPSVVGWELVGEPEASRCGPDSCELDARTCPADATAVLRSFFDSAGALLRSYDADRPIFAGLVGGDQCGLAGPGYLDVARSPGIDVLDFHDYRTGRGQTSGPLGSDLATRVRQARSAGKPLVVNEIGIDAGSCLPATTRARAFEDIIANHRALGVAGALLWAFVPDPRESSCTYDIGPFDPAWSVVRANIL
ncbi:MULTISPECIES: beta-mannosidase [unclassified Gordonia (in: high G+C Gram-positive bacteria)]|uniref:beta-mannosidase n=1 Tax=unclassified Gordonia (in: high G+C Gram-positive bacteria) TaxID=2657482 RepID=UPI0005CB7942|nr:MULTISPECIES: beta-mannosidase [unclassified Gordonia (in: high G+C Gram-positive bacteria)]